MQRELPKNEPPPSLCRAAPRSARELPQKELRSSLLRAAPRSGSSRQKGLLRPSIEQPRAAGAPPERASSLLLPSSHAQRELPKSSLLPPSLYRTPLAYRYTWRYNRRGRPPHMCRYNRRTSPADGYSRRTAPTCRYNRRMSLADGYNRRIQNSRR